MQMLCVYIQCADRGGAFSRVSRDSTVKVMFWNVQGMRYGNFPVTPLGRIWAAYQAFTA
jgi:hypothetical protein